MKQNGISFLLQDAVRMHQVGRLAQARLLYEQIIAVDAHNPEVLHFFGILLAQTGEPLRGAELLNEAISITPVRAIYHSNLGNVLKQLGKLDEAISSYRKSIQLDPTDPLPWSNLGNALRDARKPREAVEACKNAIRLRPAYASGHTNLGNALAAEGRMEEAVAAFRRAVQLSPDSPESYNNLGYALEKFGNIDEAAECFIMAIGANPRLAPAHAGLGSVRVKQGLVEEAFSCFLRAGELDPNNSENFSYLAFLAQFIPGLQPLQLLRIANSWAARFASSFVGVTRHANDSTPDRRLRIGYVSPDFRDNVMGWLIAPIIEGHDRNQFEVHCFSNVVSQDSLTQNFRANSENWHDVTGQSDIELADLINRERIDILVDLAVHTSGNRLLAFARKPAPIQISYLAYYGTSGLKTMDYVLSDRFFAPDGCCTDQFSEFVFRLSTTYWCYRPNKDAPEVESLPALSKNHITFGCLNQPSKVNEDVLNLWSKVLLEVSDSVLTILAPRGVARERIRGQFASRGVDPSRLNFVDRQRSSAYLANYNQIDIALDPFPYGGGNTTADALWMGVPVVSLAGAISMSRAGQSILSNVGFPQWVARSNEEYVRIAAKLAADTQALSLIRASLRRAMRESPMMNEKAYVSGLESAYRVMWETWCKKQGS